MFLKNKKERFGLYHFYFEVLYRLTWNTNASEGDYWQKSQKRLKNLWFYRIKLFFIVVLVIDGR